MKKMKLGFFIGVVLLAIPILCHSQNNSLGDRSASAFEEQSHKAIQKQRITKKQKLLFKKPRVRHTADYEYYHSLERVARAKQRVKLAELKARGVRDPKHSAEYEFYVRAEMVAKEKQHKMIEMAKPQFSDFTYFGHKRPPKKHLPYAMRYCKECGLRH
jgi:hypothetical protein